MADVKITDLTASLVARIGNFWEIVQTVAGSPASRKITPELMPFHGPDIAPATANALDDEFTGSTLGGGWTWENQQSATATVEQGHLKLESPTYANLINLRQTVSGNFDARCKFSKNYISTNFNHAGFTVGDSTTGRNLVIMTGTTIADIAVQRWTSVTSFSAQVGAISFNHSPHALYFRIVRDATNLTFYVSNNGVNWWQVYQEARAAWLTGAQDRIGYQIRPNGSIVQIASDWFRVT